MEPNQPKMVQFKRSQLLIGGISVVVLVSIALGVGAAALTNSFAKERARLLADLETANGDITSLQAEVERQEANAMSYQEQLELMRTERREYKTPLKLQLEPTPRLYLNGRTFTTEYVSNATSMEEIDMTGFVDLLDIYLSAQILSALDTETYYYFSLVPAEPITDDESSVFSVVYSYNKETGNLVELYSTENDPSNPSYVYIQNVNEFGLTLHSIGCNGCDFVQPEVIVYSFALQQGERIGQVLMAEVLADGAYQYKEFIPQDCPPNDPNQVANCSVAPETLEYIQGQIE